MLEPAQRRRPTALGRPDNDFTNRNQRSEWDAGCRFDFEDPEHR